MIGPLLATLSPWARLAATPVAYLLLWGGLAALSVGFLVLLRSQWGQSRPWRKCAVLSLLAHVVLACLAMTVKIVVGDGGSDGGGPIRIHVVDGPAGSLVSPSPTLTDPRMAIVETPDLLANVAEPELGDTTLIPDVAPSLNAPPLAAVEPPTTTPDLPTRPAVTDDTTASAPPEKTADATQQVENHDQSTSVVASQPPATAAQQTSSADQTRASAGTTQPMPAAVTPGDPYAGRSASDRLGLVTSQGGSTETEAAVVASLNWLASAQSPDGRWDADRFGAGIERKILDFDRHGAGRDADTGITALSLLAFLGAGHTHLIGDYQTTVQKGLEFLLHSQGADGNLYGGAGLYAQMYCHSMATFALAEAAALSRDRRLLPGVTRAASFCVNAQHPTNGGWRYEPGNVGDTSQLGWQVMGLASSERAGLDVPVHTWTGVDRFLRSVRRGPANGLAAYRADGPASTPMTAEALYCRLIMAEKTGTAVEERAALEATRQILSSLPSAAQTNVYYWYYATLALHHREMANEEAAQAWHTWNDALTKALVSSQETSGTNAGSWNPDLLWGGYGGRIYSTAMSAMCLEVYYRYAPMPAANQSTIATRPQGSGQDR